MPQDNQKKIQPQPERYSPERHAQFLLSNAIDDQEYQEACDEVRGMGLDPVKIVHYRPKRD